MPCAPDLQFAIAKAHEGDDGAWSGFVVLRERARAEGDSTQALRAAAGVVSTGHHAWQFDHFDACLDEMAAMRDGAAGLDEADELWVLNALVLGLLAARPLDRFIVPGAARLIVLMERAPDVNLVLEAARTLLFHFDSLERLEPSMRIHAFVCGRVDDPAATLHRRGQWLNMWRKCALYGKEPRAAEQALAELRTLARRHGSRRFEFVAALAELDTALPRGDVAAALRAIEEAAGFADPGNLREMLSLELSRTRVARLRAQPSNALHHARRAWRIAEELRCPAMFMATCLVNLTNALIQTEDFEGARDALDRMPAMATGYAGEAQALGLGLDVHIAARRGEDVDGPLATLLGGLRERGSFTLFEGYPGALGRLCVMALERDIEVDFVRSLIAKGGLVAPEGAPPSWPWALRIHALGGLVIWRDDLLLATEGKAQRKPLALLMAVIAAGAFSEERGVEVDRLVELLWADEEAADPRASFESALSRLRRFLGVEGALKTVDGRVSLNPRLVWCDVAAFERLCDELQQAARPAVGAVPLHRLLGQLAHTYRGRLFGLSCREPWAVQPRERLGLRFVRAVTQAGTHLEAHQRFDDALLLYESGLLQDMLAEPIHQALMRCLMSLGRRAEALQAFARCRAVLEAELGSAPSAETCRVIERPVMAR